MLKGFLSLCLLVLCACAQIPKHELLTTVRTEQYYRGPKDEECYRVKVTRLDFGNSSAKCNAIPRSALFVQCMLIKSQNQDKSQAESTYDILTKLNEQQNTISRMAVIGNFVYWITSQGNFTKATFSLNGLKEKVVSDVKYIHQITDNTLNAVIVDFNNQPGLVTETNVYICNEDKCNLMNGYHQIEHLVSAVTYKHQNKTYLFVVGEKQVNAYIVEGQIRLIFKLDSAFLQKPQLSLKAIAMYGNNILILDGVSGVMNVSLAKQAFVRNGMVYEQYGCNQMAVVQGAIVLGCTPTVKNNFILKLTMNDKSRYQVKQTIFVQERLYGVGLLGQIIMARVGSGVRLYWSSNSTLAYPMTEQVAGYLYLHDLRQMVMHGSRMLLATKDKVYAYDLLHQEAAVLCYSIESVLQEYMLKYLYRCGDSLCEREEMLGLRVWEQREVKLFNHIIPLIISIVAALGVWLGLYKLYKNYSRDIQSIKLKYNITSEIDFDQ